jgi:hypothetical protein
VVHVVTVRAELRSDTAKKAGVERTIGWGIYEVKGDKIAEGVSKVLILC